MLLAAVRPASDLLVYGAVLLVELLLRCLTPSGAMALGAAAGRLWYRLDGRRRERARQNLRVAIRGGLDVPDLEATVRETFESLIQVPIEMLLFPRYLHSARQMKRRCRCLGDWAALRDDLRGATGGLFVSGHLGNWEALGWGLRYLGVSYRVVARPIENPWIERRALRLRGGMTGVIPKRGAVRAILRTLRGRGWVGFLGDQNAGRHGLFVPFFGLPASTYPAPAALALRCGTPLYVAAGLRRPNRPFHYDLHVLRLPAADPEVDEQTAVRAGLQGILAALEDWVRQVPGQYNWIHRRWRTRPPDEVPGPKVPGYAQRREA